MFVHTIQLKRLAVAGGMAAGLVLASAPPSAAQVWYPPVYAAPDASVRFEVKPKKALVYVDGYYAGIVDDYDGSFQRLYTAPGGHEITLFLEGYRTHSERVYLAPDRTFKFRYEMEKLPPGEPSARPPAPVPPPPGQQPYPGPRGPNSRRQPPPQGAPQEPPPPGPGDERGAARGTLELTLQPADADVLVDGQSWQRSGADRVTMDLSVGRHNIQIRKAGYVGYLTDVEIRPGETTPLTVNLRTQPQR